MRRAGRGATHLALTCQMRRCYTTYQPGQCTFTRQALPAMHAHLGAVKVQAVDHGGGALAQAAGQAAEVTQAGLGRDVARQRVSVAWAQQNPSTWPMRCWLSTPRAVQTAPHAPHPGRHAPSLA